MVNLFIISQNKKGTSVNYNQPRFDSFVSSFQFFEEKRKYELPQNLNNKYSL